MLLPLCSVPVKEGAKPWIGEVQGGCLYPVIYTKKCCHHLDDGVESFATYIDQMTSSQDRSHLTLAKQSCKGMQQGESERGEKRFLKPMDI